MKANYKRLVCSIRGGEVLPIREIVREPAAGKRTCHQVLIGVTARGISRSHIGNSSAGPLTQTTVLRRPFNKVPFRGMFRLRNEQHIASLNMTYFFYTTSKNLLQPNEYTVSGATLYNRQTYMLHTNYTF